jgi:hypothetical protein
LTTKTEECRRAEQRYEDESQKSVLLRDQSRVTLGECAQLKQRLDTCEEKAIECAKFVDDVKANAAEKYAIMTDERAAMITGILTMHMVEASENYLTMHTAEATLAAAKEAIASERIMARAKAAAKPAALQLDDLGEMDTPGLTAFAARVDALCVGMASHATKLTKNPPLLEHCLRCNKRATQRGAAKGCGHACFCGNCARLYRMAECARIPDLRLEDAGDIRAGWVADGYVFHDLDVEAELVKRWGTNATPLIACPHCRVKSLSYKKTKILMGEARAEAADEASEKANALRHQGGPCTRCT